MELTVMPREAAPAALRRRRPEGGHAREEHSPHRLALRRDDAAPRRGKRSFRRAGLSAPSRIPCAMLGRFGHLRRHRSREGSAEQEAHQTVQTSTTQFGDAGPAGWSSAYEDIVGFAFWPGRYAAHLRAHGFDVVADALTGPGEVTEVARSTTGAAVQSDSNGNAAEGCFAPAGAQIEWPASQIEQDAKLDNAQRAALVKLQHCGEPSDQDHQSQRLPRSSVRCRRSIVSRRRWQELWAVRDAGIYVRAPLKAFYEQPTTSRKRLSLGSSLTIARSRMPSRTTALWRQAIPGLRGAGQEASERLLRQIEQEVQPRKEQDQAMQDLRNTVSDMAKLTSAPCGQPIPARSGGKARRRERSSVQLELRGDFDGNRARRPLRATRRWTEGKVRFAGALTREHISTPPATQFPRAKLFVTSGNAALFAALVSCLAKGGHA